MVLLHSLGEYTDQSIQPEFIASLLGGLRGHHHHHVGAVAERSEQGRAWFLQLEAHRHRVGDIEVASGAHLCADRYDGNLDDIFEFQDRW